MDFLDEEDTNMKEEQDPYYDGLTRIKEPTGGLAEVSAERSGTGRRTIRLGEDRLLDVVISGKQKLLEFKGRRKHPVRVDAQDLIKVLDKLVTEPEQN